MYEIFMPIKNYEKYYEVSNMGNIRSIRNNLILKPYKTQKGYLKINLNVNGTTKKFFIHKLVIETFKANSENKPQVDHINRIRDDNRLNNLRYVTGKENMANSLYKDEKYKKSRKFNNRDRKIICIETGQVFNSIKEAMKHVGCKSNSSIFRCIKDKTNSRTCKGFHWKYFDD